MLKLDLWILILFGCSLQYIHCFNSQQFKIALSFKLFLSPSSIEIPISTNNNKLQIFHVIYRLDARNQLLNIELYRKWFIRYLPYILRPKPIAKTGIRSYSTRKSIMTEIIRSKYAITSEEEESYNSELIPIAIFVYMWVNPSFRKLGMGDILLKLAYNEIKQRKLGNYMLLVHDDDGSGKLVQYYEDRKFLSVSEFIEKGMIIKLS